VPVAANWTALDGINAVGALAVTTTEVPSASLDVAIAAGNFRSTWSSVVSYAGIASQAMTASQTNYLYLDATGTLVVNTTGFPSGSFYVPLAIVATGSSTVTSITDQRIVCGAVNVQSQPTMGAATAGASYTSVEEGMLNTLWSVVRSLGLGT